MGFASGAAPSTGLAGWGGYGRNGDRYKWGDMGFEGARVLRAALGVWGAVALLLLAGCAQSGGGAPGQYAGQSVAPSQYYPPPGPSDDPWGPYIEEAANRYGIPAQWIRAVMAQESGGEEQAVSPLGAIGLMQVMPETYAELRDENGLGDDPFNPHDNILAGAAYIKEMYDRYGAPGFLAAYNAGPVALDAYLAGDGSLPDETQNYLAAVTPNLGDALPFSGPLAQYAAAGGEAPAGEAAPTEAAFATGCDVNAAYDPDHPCAAAPPPADVVAQAGGDTGTCDADLAYDPDNPCSAATGGAGQCDADLAYDPDSPCTAAAPVQPVAARGGGACDPDAAYDPDQPCQLAPPAPPAAVADWAVQVGAYASPGLARAVAAGAQAEAPEALSHAAIALTRTTPFGGIVLYQARLVNLPAASAINACASLSRRQLPCVVVPGEGA